MFAETSPTAPARKQANESSTDQTVVVQWSGPDDPHNPYNWPLKKKWFAVGLGLFATFISMMNGTIITTAHEAIGEDFNVSDANFPHSYWPVTSWGLGGALFSLVLLPIMEDFGMRIVFLSVYTVFLCFLIPVGIAQNYETLIITRFFSGGCCTITERYLSRADAPACWRVSNAFHLSCQYSSSLKLLSRKSYLTIETRPAESAS